MQQSFLVSVCPSGPDQIAEGCGWFEICPTGSWDRKTTPEEGSGRPSPCTLREGLAVNPGCTASSPWLSLTLQEPAAALHSGPESLLVGVVPAWKPLLCSFDMPKCVVLRKKQNKEHLTWYKKGDQRPPKYFTRVVEK